MQIDDYSPIQYLLHYKHLYNVIYFVFEFHGLFLLLISHQSINLLHNHCMRSPYPKLSTSLLLLLSTRPKLTRTAVLLFFVVSAVMSTVRQGAGGWLGWWWNGGCDLLHVHCWKCSRLKMDACWRWMNAGVCSGVVALGICDQSWLLPSWYQCCVDVSCVASKLLVKSGRGAYSWWCVRLIYCRPVVEWFLSILVKFDQSWLLFVCICLVSMSFVNFVLVLVGCTSIVFVVDLWVINFSPLYVQFWF